MITSISMENWRSHNSTSLSFKKGTNLIIGIMGSGKSSVLDAICFALFSTFPAIEHRRMTLADIVMHDKDSARIKLAFEWKGEKYAVTRELKKDRKGGAASGNAEIRKGGALVEKGQNAVTSYIGHLLQVDYGLFSRAIYSSQNRIDYFMAIEPSKRREEIDELLGLDKFEMARENAVTLINRIRFARKAFEEKFSKQKLEGARKKETEAREGIALLEKRIGEAGKSAENNKSLYEGRNSLFSKLRELREKSGQLRQAVAKSRGAAGQLKEQLAGQEPDGNKLEEVARRRAESEAGLSAQKEALVKFQAAQNALSKQMGALEARLDVAKAASTELGDLKSRLTGILNGKTAEELSVERANMEKEAVGLEAEGRSLLARMSQIENAMKALSPELSNCPVCSQQLTRGGIAHVRKEYDSEILELRKKAASVSELKKGKADAYSTLQSRMREIEKLAQKQAMLEKESAKTHEISGLILDMRPELSKIGQAVQEKKQECEKLALIQQESAIECMRLEEIGARKKRLVEVEAQAAKLEAERTSLNFNEGEFEDARKECEELRGLLERALAELSSARREMERASELSKLAGIEVAELEGLESKISEFSALEEELSIYKNALLEIQSGLRKDVIEAINSAMNSIWQVIYPYGDYRGLRINAGEKGYSFEVQDGEWRSAELVSGGERASIALTFRIALATVLTPNVSMLALDEPTHNLDKEAVAVLAQALQFRLPELVEQSFVITHDEGLMGSEFATTYRMSRDKDSNGPTVAEEA